MAGYFEEDLKDEKDPWEEWEEHFWLREQDEAEVTWRV